MASAAGTYKRILNLLEKWPLDKNKSGRDLGEYISNYINQAYKDNLFETNPKYWDRQFISLQKLINNEHKEKYKRTLNSSSTGLTAEECNIALSNEFLKELKEEEKCLRTLCTTCQGAETSPSHIPVMAEEVLSYMNVKHDQILLDMTFGAGGHSKKLLKAVPNLKILALDRDPTAHGYAQQLAEEYPNQVTPLLGKFSDVPELMKSLSMRRNSLDGVLFDFGCSSMQFDQADRGFSVSKNGPLDMRMDGNRIPESPTAADVLAKATEDDIYKILKVYGEEKQARKIARAIIEARYLFKKLSTTQELTDLVESVVTDDFRLDKLQRKSHVATKTFQALRIFVNNELNEINYGLILAHHFLKLGGRIITITFHSLEDIVVKRHLTGNVIENTANPLPLKYSSFHHTIEESMVKEVMEPKWKLLHKHVLLPTEDEIGKNPRSRSAKLRAAVKVK